MARAIVTVTLNRFPEIARRLPEAAAEIVQETVLEIETIVKAGMAGSHSGAVYGGHQASAPGEMPAIDTGNLAGSIQTEAQGPTGAVYTNAEYAPHLEYGTINMAARPFMTPAAEQARASFMRKCRNLEDRL